MKLAGLNVHPDDVLELAQRLRREGFQATGDSLEGALTAGVKRVGLTIHEREQVVRALADCPEALSHLRSVLLQEAVARRRNGL